MKKFGFGKKSDKGGAQDANPYAQQPAEDPYANAPPMTAYQQARAGLPSGPRAGGLPSGPGPRNGGFSTPPPPYTGSPQPSAGYGSDRFGASGGYGGNRYDNNAASYNANQQATSTRTGGYGGFGGASNTNLEEKRDDLFGGARTRYQDRQQGGYNPADDQYGQSGASGADSSYGGYGDRRELTAEEQEEEDVKSNKNEIKRLKAEGADLTDRVLQSALASVELSQGTLARLGAQGERLHNTEKNLDLAATYNRVGEESTKKLQTLNRSMFAVHVANPFTAKQRRADQDEKILRQHQVDREQREATRQAAFASNQRMEDAFGRIGASGGMQLGQKSAAEKNQYSFEDDSEDEENESRINRNLDQISVAVGQLNQIGRAIGSEVDEQNKRIDIIAGKSDAVDDGVRLNQARLNRIK